MNQTPYDRPKLRGCIIFWAMIIAALACVVLAIAAIVPIFH